MGLAGTGAADQNSVASLGKEAAAGEIANERLVDRGAGELEVVEILGERQLGNSELVTDRTCLLLIDLGGQQIANDALGLKLGASLVHPSLLAS